VRVSTAFERLLRLPGAGVTDVSFTGEGVVVTVRLRCRRRVCGGCGQTGPWRSTPAASSAGGNSISAPAAASSSASCAGSDARTVACAYAA
jgi:hypothetical protein